MTNEAIIFRTVFFSLLVGLLLSGSGCRLDIFRLRSGRLVEPEAFEELRVDESTLEDALDTLGAPDRIEWKTGDDFLWYDYADEIDVELRFQIPSTVIGYQHNFLRLSENSANLNTAHFVFDEDHVLRHKSLRVDEEYERASGDAPSAKIHIVPRLEYGVLLLGDAGFEDFDEVFENGFRAGVDIGIQPVPAFTFLIAGSYQEYQGDSLFRNGNDLNFDDLKLFQLEVGVRLAAPVRLVRDLSNFEEVKHVLFSEDLNRTEGWYVYLQGTTGLTVNSNLPVKINGNRAGNFYDNALLFSGSIGGGVEYARRWGALHLGVTYASVDPFDEGSTLLDDDSSSFRSLLVGGGMSLKF